MYDGNFGRLQGRRRIVRIPMEQLPKLLTGRRRISNFPPDVAIGRASFDYGYDSMAFVIYSKNFEKVAEGMECKYFNVEYVDDPQFESPIDRLKY